MPSLYEVKADLRKSWVICPAEWIQQRGWGRGITSTEIIWKSLSFSLLLPVFWCWFILIITFISEELSIAQELKVLFKLAQIIDRNTVTAAVPRIKHSCFTAGWSFMKQCREELQTVIWRRGFAFIPTWAASRHCESASRSDQRKMDDLQVYDSHLFPFDTALSFWVFAPISFLFPSHGFVCL